MLLQRLLLLLLAIALSCPVVCRTAAAGQSQVWVRSSQYVAVRDGTKIALDCYIPDHPAISREIGVTYPVLLRVSPYGRRFAATPPDELPQGGLGLNGPEVVQQFVMRGYVFCIADARGYGASFGARSTWLGLQDSYDIRDIVDWLGAQHWSNRRVGMIGSSWLGSVQYWALIDPSPYLKALFVGKAQYDHYATFFDNGIYRPDVELAWHKVRNIVDFGADSTGVAAVDGDEGRVLLQAARADHKVNAHLGPQIRPLVFRENIDNETGQSWHLDNSVWFHMSASDDQSVAIYHVAGWWDAYAKDQLLAYENFAGPKRLHIGPYFHGESFGIDLIDEALRWFDHWLMRIDNGIMTEPAIRYFRMGVGWEQHGKWSPAGDKALELYLGSDMKRMSGTTAIERNSVPSTMLTNHHFLLRNNGTHRQGLCGERTDAPAGCYAFPNMDDMGFPITSTTQRFVLPLSRDLEVTGHPLVTLWLSPLNEDVELSIVMAIDLGDGRQGYASAASLKVSHRGSSAPPIDHLGLPWLNQSRVDTSEEQPGPIKITVDLKPVAARFPAGSNLILMVTAMQPIDESSGNPVPLEIFQRQGLRSLLRLPVSNDVML